MKSISSLFVAILLFLFTNTGFSQNLGAKLTFNETKYGFGSELFEFSFTLEASERALIDKTFLLEHLPNSIKKENIQILVDDQKPIAAVIINVDIKTQSDFEHLLRTLYSQWGLNFMEINDKKINSKEDIRL